MVPSKANDPWRIGVNNRLTFEGILYIVRTGAFWRSPQLFNNML